MLNDYYKFKNNYENEILKEKKKIIKNQELSWKEKRNEFKTFKPKCINCKRPVGTIFSIKYNTEVEFRELKAICGSRTDPCNLNININPGVTYNIMDHIKELENDNNEYKNNIIDDKNKLLFGYISSETAINNFDGLKDAISDINYLLNINYETLLNVTDNTNTNNLIAKLQEETYILINDIKQTIKEYNSTNDVQFVRDGVEMYINQLQPKLKELMSSKYKNKLVEYDEQENEYILIQQKYTILDLEDDYVKPEVKSFVYGDVSKSKKQKSTKSSPKNKKSLVIENEEVHEIPTSRPKIQENGNIIWDNPDYELLWKKLPIKYKEALASDREWLQYTMDTYVKDIKDKKALTFVSPDNLILPPQILDDGTYDFGNNIYNDIFNKLDKSYQKTLLTLYTDENGTKNYNMLINALSSIIGNELGFKNYY